MRINHIDSEMFLKSDELVPSPEQLEKIASRLAEKGWRSQQKEDHLALLYPEEFEWLPPDAACGYLWRTKDDWHWSLHESRWWCLFCASNSAPDQRNQLLEAIKQTLDELDL